MVGNRDRDFYVTREMAEKVLQACPDAEWRLLFALARIGGFRCPSEHQSLRLDDVDWNTKRIYNDSPKTGSGSLADAVNLYHVATGRFRWRGELQTKRWRVFIRAMWEEFRLAAVQEGVIDAEETASLAAKRLVKRLSRERVMAPAVAAKSKLLREAIAMLGGTMPDFPAAEKRPTPDPAANRRMVGKCLVRRQIGPRRFAERWE